MGHEDEIDGRSALSEGDDPRCFDRPLAAHGAADQQLE